MPSSFPTSTDVIPDTGPTLATPTHSSLHNNLRDGLVAVQNYVKTQIAAITGANWVTNVRIASGAVTDRNIVTMNVQKLSGNTWNDAPNIISTGNGGFDGWVQGVKGIVAGHGPSGSPQVIIQRYGGVLNGFGGAVVAHNLQRGNGAVGARVIGASVFYKGGSGEQVQLASSSITIDGTNLIIVTGNGALNGRPWIGSLTYTFDAVAW